MKTLARPALCLFVLLAASSCSTRSGGTPNMEVYIPKVVDTAESWPAPQYADALYGARLLHDGVGAAGVTLAIARAVLRTNPQITPIAALELATAAVRSAKDEQLQPEFFAAMLLQESAFDPRALSSAGAIGIAQFMPETAAAAGVDPFDPFAAIRGSAALIASYLRDYESFPNPYVEALAAYNAGPGAVAAYGGVPPYEQTREYIDDVFDRWAKIESGEKPILPR